MQALVRRFTLTLVVTLFTLCTHAATLHAGGPGYQIYIPAIQQPNAGKLSLKEDTAVGYATATDRTLIRWVWVGDDAPDHFRVYRRVGIAPETLLAEVTPTTDPAAATALLNSTASAWPTLAADLIDNLAAVGVIDMSSLQARLQEDRFMAQQIANEFYPVALMMGWGYLDLDIDPAQKTFYRVEAVDGNNKVTVVGEVTVTPGILTPFVKPANLNAVSMTPATSDHALPRDGEWGAVQRNRRFHQSVYLRWDQNAEVASPEGAWVAGYDVYREGQGGAFARVSSDEAIRPMPASQPISETTPGDAATAYEEIDFFFAEDLAAPGVYTYRVAPRDLLGHVRQWPQDAAQFSDPAQGMAEDFVPPAAPRNLVATLLADGSGVALSWVLTPTADLAGVRIERTLWLNSPIAPDVCAGDHECWQEAVTLGPDATTWTDLDAGLESVRWYRVQTVDAAGNRSYAAGPAQAVLHDNTPPPPPQVNFDSCNKQGFWCIWGSSDAPDVTRLRVACRFDPQGEEILIDEIPGNSLNAYSVVEAAYAPPLDLANLQCSVYAVDAHGNVSDPGKVELPWLDSPLPPQVGQPVITQIETLGSSNDLTARVHWEITDSPLIAQFHIARTDIHGLSEPLAKTVDASARHFDDDSVEVGHTYLYTVSAELKFGNGSKASLPRLYRATADGLRGLQEFDWVALQWNNGVMLSWDACNVVGTEPTFWFAVYRSIDMAQGYQQITPIMPISTCVGDYFDSSARHPDYWYVVAAFHTRTGEAIGYTAPQQAPPPPPSASTSPSYIPQPGQHSLLHTYAYQSSNSIAILPCSAVAPGALAPGTILTLGGDFTLEIVNANVSHDTLIIGSGLLHMTANGQPLAVPVDFSDVTVGDDQGHICHTGSLTHISLGDLLSQPVEVAPEGELPYRVIGLTLRSWYLADNRAYGEIIIDLPPSVRAIGHTGSESATLRLAGEALTLDNSLHYQFELDLTTLPLHTCENPILAWRLETLPVTVVPQGVLHVLNDGISSTTSCMRYVELYTGANGPRPTPTNHDAGDANDGFLRGAYTGGFTTIASNGLSGDFQTGDDLSWIAAYPYGFNVSITGDVQLALQSSRISNGTAGAGGIQLGYAQKVDGSVQPFSVTFAQAEILQNGALFAQVQTGESLEWLVPGGFRVDPGAWEFYAGPVTTPGLPATVVDGLAQAVMFDPRPGATTPIDNPSQIALPGALEPGINRRVASAPLHWGNCCGPEVTFSAAQDLYVRHGGVSGRFIAHLAGLLTVPIHGYTGRLDHFELAFLDNGIWDSNITSEIDIPFPSQITLRLVDMWLAGDGCGACLGGGIVPPDQRDHHLVYWQVDVHLHSVEFHPDAPGPEPICERLLVANGSMTVPRLAIPGASAPTDLDIEMVFLPNGMAVPHITAYTRGDYLVDGFPFLLEGLRLSSLGEDAKWAANAMLADPPAANWNQVGFVALQGAFAARYFGLLEGQQPGPDHRPEVRYQAAPGGFLGLAERLVAEKVWVDLGPANLTFRYDMVGFGPVGELGFGAAQRFAFLPDSFLQTLPGDAADELQIIHLDTSVVLEADRITLFGGLSSGVALLRALAEANGGAQPNLAVAEAWGGKMGINAPADYHELLTAVWSGYGDQSYLATTNVLDAYDDQPNHALPDDPGFGGGTDGFLDKAGAKFKRLRGDIQFIDGDDPGRLQLDHFALSCQVDIWRGGEAGSLFYAERLGFEINRHADYILEAMGVTSRLYASDLSLDATLRINVDPDQRQFEGGLTLYDFDLSNVHVLEGAAVLGVGKQANYVGATFVASFSSGPTGGSAALGGSFLAGTIDPSSPVLQNHFGEVVTKLAEVPSSPNDPTPPTTLNGVYLRMYGDVTLWNDGGLLQVNGGGEIAAWLWVDNIGEFTDIPDEITDVTQLLNFVTFGGKYRYFIHGKIITVISARGDLTMTYWDRPGDVQPESGGVVEQILDDVINRKRSLSGLAWVAGGLGLCDAETWTSWETRWWNDKWCWTAGATLEVTVNLEGINPQGIDLDVSWDADYEGS